MPALTSRFNSTDPDSHARGSGFFAKSYRSKTSRNAQATMTAPTGTAPGYNRSWRFNDNLGRREIIGRRTQASDVGFVSDRVHVGPSTNAIILPAANIVKSCRCERRQPAAGAPLPSFASDRHNSAAGSFLSKTATTPWTTLPRLFDGSRGTVCASDLSADRQQGCYRKAATTHGSVVAIKGWITTLGRGIDLIASPGNSAQGLASLALRTD
jgi:hypothetical protein